MRSSYHLSHLFQLPLYLATENVIDCLLVLRPKLPCSDSNALSKTELNFCEIKSVIASFLVQKTSVDVRDYSISSMIRVICN